MLTWLVLIVAGYLLGSVPLSYLVAKSRGVDLSSSGTGQVGAGNLTRMLSPRLGVPVAAFDVIKGILMVWLSYMTGLSLAQQIVVGLAVVIGHNWPLFLHFNGGRGVGTMLGVVFILLFLGQANIAVILIFFAVLVVTWPIFRATALPILLALVSLPVTCPIFGEPLGVTLAFSLLLGIIVVRRLTAPIPDWEKPVKVGRMIYYRLLFDRDIPDAKAWMYHNRPENRPR